MDSRVRPTVGEVIYPLILLPNRRVGEGKENRVYETVQ